MGGCVSKPEGCVGKRLKLKRRRRRKGKKSRARSFDMVNHSDRSSYNRAFSAGSKDTAWFDSVAIFESDSDNDFESVPDGTHYNEHPIYADGLDRSVSSGSSLKDGTHGSLSKGKQPVHVDGSISSLDESTGRDSREAGILDHCGILPNNCLPCLASTAPTVEKTRSIGSNPPSLMKKAALKLSFKSREGHASASVVASSKMPLRKPVAGSQIPFCPMEKKMLDCWSCIEPSSFKVRAKNYLRDKKKDFAPNHAAYYPFGVDVFLSPRKINHIARFVELPVVSSSEQLPPILVVNVQIPLYPASLFQSETDGEGMCYVIYFKLSENFCKEIPSHFQESIRRVIDDEKEKVKGFAINSTLPFRERLKILGRVANVDDLPLNAPEKKLMHAYNEKPILSRPQHEFYLGQNYLEIDLDMHRFSYISRKGFDAFQHILKHCVLDIGLTIQGNKAEELPEQILCCIRLSAIDYMKYNQLDTNEEASE